MQVYLPLIMFYFFAAITVISGFFVITQNNPVRSVLFLVLAFFASAVLWLLVEAEFLALILVLVYVGAVMTLFLFIVMMLNIEIETQKSHLLRHLPIALIVAAFLVGLLLSSLPVNVFPLVNTAVPLAPMPLSNTEALGVVLYTHYVYAFELAAAILLVAIIAAITLVHRNVRRSKQQSVLEQLMTSREERIKLVSMKSEHGS